MVGGPAHRCVQAARHLSAEAAASLGAQRRHREGLATLLGDGDGAAGTWHPLLGVSSCRAPVIRRGDVNAKLREGKRWVRRGWGAAG